MWKRFLLAAVSIFVLTAAATATTGLATVSRVAHNLSLGAPRIRSRVLTPDKPGAAQTILIIGDDRRALTKVASDQSTYGNTDTMMLVRMDPTQGQTSILSIPRDLMVNFTWHGAYYPNEKINSAYSIGGAQLMLQVVKQALGGIVINHVIDLNFASFRAVVDAIGCVYIDVDQRYYNENIGTPATDYSNINIEPGYQKLCGQTALDYVRYRHTDSDFVRVARQQDFIRQAKEQVGLSGLLDNYDALSRAFGESIQTDIRGTSDVLRLLKLAAFSLSRPVRQVPFQADPDTVINSVDYVTATHQQITSSVNDFLHGDQHVQLPHQAPVANSTAHRRRHHGHGASAGRPASSGPAPSSIDLFALVPGARQQMVSGLAGNPFPLLLPNLQTGPASSTGVADIHRYGVRDEQGHLYWGYRVDWAQNGLGGYYGVEGMNWTDPPLFANPTQTLRLGTRDYMLIDDGAHIHDIGWREDGALYWVSNTLLEDLTNAQMIALAQSVHPAS